MPDFSIADILARGYEQRRKTMESSQPDALLPTLGGLANRGFQIADQNKQRQSVLQAQQDYARYLATQPEQRNQNISQSGLQGALSLGLNPLPATRPAKPTEDQKVINIEKESEARAKGTAKGQTSGGSLTPDLQKKFAQQIATGTPPDQISKPFGRKAYLMMPGIMEEAYKINPNLKLMTSNLDYQTKLALMKTDMGSAVQLPARKIASILPRIDSAVAASDKLPRSSIQVINKLGIKAAAQAGNREAQNLLSQSKLVADEFQSTIGSGSDSKLDLAMDLLGSSQTVEQFRDSAKNLKDAMVARRSAILTGDVPTNSPDVKYSQTATGEGGKKIGLNPSTGQWEPIK